MLRKLFFTLALLAFFLPAEAQVTKVLGIRNVSTDTYTDLLHFQTFEANDNADTYDFGAGEYPSGRSGTYGFNACDGTGPDNCNNTASARYGTYGYDSWNTTNDANMRFFSVAPPQTEINIGFWLYAPTIVNSRIWTTYQGTGTFSINLDFNATAGSIRCTYSDGAVTGVVSSTANGIAAATWYFVTCAADTTVDPSVIRATVREFGQSIQTFTSTANDFAVPATVWNGFYMGATNSAVIRIFMDNFMISNDYARDLDALRDLTTSPR